MNKAFYFNYYYEPLRHDKNYHEKIIPLGQDKAWGRGGEGGTAE